MSSLDIELVCDGSSTIGYGHVRRSLALAETLRACGVAVRLSALTSAAQAMLPTQSVPTGPARVLVLDVPEGADTLIRDGRGAGQIVVALDWFGGEDPDIAIVVHPHQPVRSRRASFVGWHYQMIRAEISAQPRGLVGKNVIVMLGGGDLLKQGHAAAQRLTDQGISVTLVQGPLAADRAGSGEYEVLHDPPDLARRLAECAWVVTNGGGCMFEAMCLGKAAVVLPQTENEWVLALAALDQRSVLGIGPEHLRPYAREELQRVAQRGPELIDGRGTERVATIVRGQL